MFKNLQQQPPDKILALITAFKEDPRDQKLDLGVGVYKDPTGITPIMRSIKLAEKKWWEIESSKSYVGLVGDPAFSDAIISLVLGNSIPRNLIASAATPGGTGAVRQGFELFKIANPGVRVFVSDPTWPNHISILQYLNIPSENYRYFDNETRGVDFDSMVSDLSRAKAGDVILLHGCCHNPTGANLDKQQWKIIIDLLNKNGATPMIDLAYQGFGDGLEEDAYATRLIAESVPETVIASSCSKNFGIYRERAGLLMLISQDSSKRNINQSMLAYLNRQNYSFPPDHGSRLVSIVLNDKDLRSDWMSELEDIRNSLLNLRVQLSDELQKISGSNRFSFIASHRGMFSRLGATPSQVEKMRKEFGIYMVSDSRFNVAGLNNETVPALAKAIIETGV
ncbi:MAG: aromatic amino acid transaminase [Paracoccaceae bacterium]|uniref:amino acid aminotransferase n=1 Tax=Candidatus Salinivivens marinus TaxID=3381703 RepID=UPI000BE03715|nr:MAG: aromatic amino acid aminotransferase [Rhodobacteraceae bacterium MED-G08]